LQWDRLHYPPLLLQFYQLIMTPIYEGKAECRFQSPIRHALFRIREIVGDVMENYLEVLSRAEHAVGS
jgi:hypothetical protein